MNRIQFYNLTPGDRVIVRKSALNLVQHHVIFLGQNFLGEDLIGENAPGLYVRVITAEHFFRENPTITSIKRFPGNPMERRLAIKRALEKLGQPYSLINFNCEHFANFVQSGQVRSPQVGWGLALLAIVIFAALSD